jgi:hypothetical protein
MKPQILFAKQYLISLTLSLLQTLNFLLTEVKCFKEKGKHMTPIITDID